MVFVWNGYGGNKRAMHSSICLLVRPWHHHELPGEAQVEHLRGPYLDNPRKIACTKKRSFQDAIHGQIQSQDPREIQFN